MLPCGLAAATLVIVLMLTGKTDWRAFWASGRAIAAVDPGVAAAGRIGKEETGVVACMG